MSILFYGCLAIVVAGFVWMARDVIRIGNAKQVFFGLFWIAWVLAAITVLSIGMILATESLSRL